MVNKILEFSIVFCVSCGQRGANEVLTTILHRPNCELDLNSCPLCPHKCYAVSQSRGGHTFQEGWD